jgi:hypothetical protein
MRFSSLMFSLALSLSLPASASENPTVVKAMEEYLDFNEYGSSLIWPEQIPAEDWKSKGGFEANKRASHPAGH